MSFNPSQECHSCGRMTNLGTFEPPTYYSIGDREERNIPALYAYCPTHHYSESYTENEQHLCIRRFIYDQLTAGRVIDITRLPDIEPGQQHESGYVKAEDDHWRDYAWRFTFISRNTGEQQMYAVFSVGELEFVLVNPLEQASL